MGVESPLLLLAYVARIAFVAGLEQQWAELSSLVAPTALMRDNNDPAVVTAG